MQAGKFSVNKEQVLSPAETEYCDRWLGTLPSQSWTERYDGGWDAVQGLMAASREEARAQEQRLVAEARALAEKERAEAEKERADQQARLARRLAYLSVALAVVMVLAAVVGVYAWWQQQIAEEQRQEAEEQRHLTEAQRQIAEAQRELAEEQRGLAQAVERQRTDDLFQSQLTHATLLAEGEEYAKAREVLEESRELDYQIALERRHARDFLARYVEIMSGSPQQVYEGAGVPLYAVALSPDGDLLAAVGEHGTAVLFDVETGAIRQRLEGHRGNVWNVAFHPEGAWLVTGGEVTGGEATGGKMAGREVMGGDSGQIIRWSLPSPDSPAEQLQAWDAPGQVWSVAVSPDGQLLATGGRDTDISLWQAETGKLVRRLKGHDDTIAANAGLAFSPSGGGLASASYDRTARIW